MKKMSLLTVLVAAVALTAYSVSGTYAKYTSTFEGSDSARVAKWAFQINDKDPEADNSFTFNLFETINDTDGTTAETDVAKGTDENIIAPGTSGSFNIKLANNSEVNAQYSISYTVVNTDNIPVEFSVDNVTTLTSNIADLNVADTAINMNNASDEVTVQWRWVYERGDDDTAKGTNNAADTALGNAGTATLSVTATIVATQVD